MDKYYKIILILLISVAFPRCSEDLVIYRTDDAAVTPDEVVNDLNEPIVIRYNHIVLIKEERLLIKFKNVTEGRCPIGVHCFWEGQAIGDFLLIKPNVGRGIASPIIRPGMRPDSDYQDFADDALGYRLFLLELNPYPHIDKPTNPKDYIAKLRVEKLPEY
ncbi:MAG: hypothetical protein JSV33_03350 [bacterium]|nr:MAG: hypothetical protein JSV33_03350 [bacterium]